MPALHKTTSPQMEHQWPPDPPADETDAQRRERLEREKEAKAVSDAIDQSLLQEKDSKKTLSVKVLLLGT